MDLSHQTYMLKYPITKAVIDTSPPKTYNILENRINKLDKVTNYY